MMAARMVQAMSSPQNFHRYSAGTHDDRAKDEFSAVTGTLENEIKLPTVE